MWQVQWGYTGYWNNKVFDGREEATIFWKETVNSYEGKVKVFLIEKVPGEDPHTIMSQGGMK